MHRRTCLTLIGPLAAVLAVGERLGRVHASGDWSPVANQSSDEEVLAAERDRFAAMVKSDVVALDTLLAAELSYTHGDGRVVDKAAFLADLKSGDFKYLSIQPTNVRVRLFGDTAIVTGTAGMQVVNKGSPAQIRIVYTNTHIKRRGSWQLMAWHATRTAA